MQQDRVTLNNILEHRQLALFYLRELQISCSHYQCCSSKGTCQNGDIYRRVQISCSTVPSGFDKKLQSPIFQISTRDTSLRYLSMVVCISKQTPSSQVFHLKHFSSATCNLKVLSYWNISCFQMIAFGYRRRSSILPLQVQHTLFFGNGLVTSHLSTTSLT